MVYIIGQVLSWIAASLTFVAYQCRTHKQLLTVQVFSSICLSISYVLLGAYSAMAMNIVCALRNIVIMKKSGKLVSYSYFSYILAGIMGLVGLLSWQGPLSAIVVTAFIINTLYSALPNIQNLRKSIIVTCSMVMVYDAIYGVWGGVCNELISITSAAIGLYRFKNSTVKKDI